MKLALLELLACPECGGNLDCRSTESDERGDVLAGELVCRGCSSAFPVRAGIPRFVPGDDYASSFGLQWNQFRREQLDSDTGAGLSRQRFFAETGLHESELGGMRVLDAGCGAGRFLEIASAYGCKVVGVDISSAVEAAAETVRDRPNAQVVQASILALPFKSGAFDLCYSIGVLQHTPNAQEAAAALPRVVRAGGRVAVTVYERKPWTLLNAKYLIRPLTRRLNPRLLLGLVKVAVTVLFPLTDLLFRIPLLGRVFSFVIPICDYSRVTKLGYLQRYRAVVLDTFDMLSPTYDRPMTRSELEGALVRAGVHGIRRMSSIGLTLVGEKA